MLMRHPGVREVITVPCEWTLVDQYDLFTIDKSHKSRATSCKTTVYQKQLRCQGNWEMYEFVCSLQWVCSLLSVDIHFVNCFKINSRESPSIHYLWII
jgi:hypothetical protein